MKSILKKEILIPLSLCDNTAKLSIPGIFVTFMDMASEHGTQIGLGAGDLSKKDLFWLAVKTKIKIYRRPEMLEKVEGVSWPEKPVKIRCNRYYQLLSEGNAIVEGKTEWAMINIKTGKLCRYDEIYPNDIDHIEDKVCEEPFARVSSVFNSDEKLGVYKVKSTDIDLGQHLNNSVYVRIIFGMFSCSELEKLDIKEMEISFKSPCYEGDELSVFCKEYENYYEIVIKREDGTTAVLSKIVF